MIAPRGTPPIRVTANASRSSPWAMRITLSTSMPPIAAATRASIRVIIASPSITPESA